MGCDLRNLIKVDLISDNLLAILSYCGLSIFRRDIHPRCDLVSTSGNELNARLILGSFCRCDAFKMCNWNINQCRT